jgi:hypothetical protein
MTTSTRGTEAIRPLPAGPSEADARTLSSPSPSEVGEAGGAPREASSDTLDELASAIGNAAPPPPPAKKGGRPKGSKNKTKGADGDGPKQVDWKGQNGALHGFLAETLLKFPDSKEHKLVLELKAKAANVIGPSQEISAASITTKSTVVRKAAKEIEALVNKISNGTHAVYATEAQKSDTRAKFEWMRQVTVVYTDMGIGENVEAQMAFASLGEVLNSRAARIIETKDKTEQDRNQKEAWDAKFMEVRWCFPPSALTRDRSCIRRKGTS